MDASAIVPFFVRSEHTPYARTLVNSLRTGELWMPGFGLVQVANTIWQAVEAGDVEPEHADVLVREWLTLPVSFRPVREVALRAFGVAMRARVNMYAAHTIALAEQLSCPLVTLDESQARAAAACGVDVKPLADFPPTGAPDTGVRR